MLLRGIHSNTLVIILRGPKSSLRFLETNSFGFLTSCRWFSIISSLTLRVQVLRSWWMCVGRHRKYLLPERWENAAEPVIWCRSTEHESCFSFFPLSSSFLNLIKRNYIVLLVLFKKKKKKLLYLECVKTLQEYLCILSNTG